VVSPGGYLATRYDRPGGVPAPAVLSTGSDPALRLVDGFVRGRRMLGRCRTSPAALGVTVEPAAHPLRFTIEFLLDRITPEWWADGHDHAAGSVLLPRLLLIRAQRRLRGAVVLRPHPEHRPVRAEFSFELAPAEIPDGGGLVLLEIWGFREWPAAAARAPRADLAPRGPVGVGITTLTVRPAPPGTRRSSGRPRVAAAAAGEPLVVDPAGGPTRVTLVPAGPEQAADGAAAPRPRRTVRRTVRGAGRKAARWAVRLARRAARRALRMAGRAVRLASGAVAAGLHRLRSLRSLRRRTGGARPTDRAGRPVRRGRAGLPPVRAMDLVDGGAVEVDLGRGGGRHEITVTVPASPHPVLVWLETEHP
jgi:hypothetical protein